MEDVPPEVAIRPDRVRYEVKPYPVDLPQDIRTATTACHKLVSTAAFAAALLTKQTPPTPEAAAMTARYIGAVDDLSADCRDLLDPLLQEFILGGDGFTHGDWAAESAHAAGLDYVAAVRGAFDLLLRLATNRIEIGRPPFEYLPAADFEAGYVAATELIKREPAFAPGRDLPPGSVILTALVREAVQTAARRRGQRGGSSGRCGGPPSPRRSRGGQPKNAAKRAADLELYQAWKASGSTKAEFVRDRGLNPSDALAAIERGRKDAAKPPGNKPGQGR